MKRVLEERGDGERSGRGGGAAAGGGTLGKAHRVAVLRACKSMASSVLARGHAKDMLPIAAAVGDACAAYLLDAGGKEREGDDIAVQEAMEVVSVLAKGGGGGGECVRDVLWLSLAGALGVESGRGKGRGMVVEVAGIQPLPKGLVEGKGGCRGGGGGGVEGAGGVGHEEFLRGVLKGLSARGGKAA